MSLLHDILVTVGLRKEIKLPPVRIVNSTERHFCTVKVNYINGDFAEYTEVLKYHLSDYLGVGKDAIAVDRDGFFNLQCYDLDDVVLMLEADTNMDMNETEYDNMEKNIIQIHKINASLIRDVCMSEMRNTKYGTVKHVPRY